MALDQLLGPKIQLTLNIKEGPVDPVQGHGFGFLTCPILVSASLKGHVIETDIVQPSPNPEFGTQLVWETDKKKIKRLRCENTVLKIDCKQIVNKRSERIGYIFINLKQAQIVPRGKQPTDTWLRLLGICKEARSLTPELFLSLAIEDIPESISATVPQCLPLPDENNQEAKENKNSTVGFMVMPVYHEDESTIQLGPDTPLSEVFLFTIQILAVNNLKVLIPEDTEVTEGPYIVYSLMGHTVKSQSLSGYEQGSNKIDNRVVIRVRSTVLMLSAYFKQSPDAELKLIINDDRALGSSSIHLQKLVPSEDFATICNKFGKHNSRYIETRCHILQNNEADLIPTEERASIDVIVRLSYENKQPKNKPKTSELPDNRQSHPITPTSRGGEDSRNEEVEVTNANEPLTIPPLESQLNSVPGNMTYRANKDGEPLTSYVLTVVVKSIVVNKLPGSGTLEFRFLHSGTDITNPSKQKFVISAVNEKINLPFTEARLCFSSPVDLVDNFLESHPVEITLYDKTEIFATSVLNLCKAQKEDSICLPLESNKVQSGFIYVKVLIQERQHQPSPMAGSEESSSASTQCNEEVLEKIVSELEDWKEKQQQMYQDELEEKEKQHLAKIEEDWLIRKKAIEITLLEQVESNKRMSESLTTAISNLKLREEEIKEQEIELQTIKDELEKKYTMMFQELKEASIRMQEDLNCKLQQMPQETCTLEKHVASLESDKTNLMKIVDELQIQIKADRTEKLTKEVESLLKQMEGLKSQLDTEIQSKNYFKEQWGKAVRELHMLKPKHDAMEQLKETEEGRNNINSFYQILFEEEQAMKQDQIKLKQLRSELCTQHKSQDSTVAPVALTRASSCSDTSKWKQKNMIEKLIQQRNEMLLAGDSLYANHIQRLNQQISFLMR